MPKTISTVAAYIRVSSSSQDLAMQRAAIVRAARSHRDKIRIWYAEKTPGVDERPELERLRNDIRLGRVKRCYVYRLDRLSRAGILEVFKIVKELQSYGCNLVTVADGFSLDGPAADVILAVFAWVAEMERAAIRERLATARRERAAKGLPWGRPSRIGDKLGEKILRLRARGKSIRSIAGQFSIPYATIARFLVRSAA